MTAIITQSASTLRGLERLLCDACPCDRASWVFLGAAVVPVLVWLAAQMVFHVELRRLRRAVARPQHR